MTKNDPRQNCRAHTACAAKQNGSRGGSSEDAGSWEGQAQWQAAWQPAAAAAQKKQYVIPPKTVLTVQRTRHLRLSSSGIGCAPHAGACGSSPPSCAAIARTCEHGHRAHKLRHPQRSHHSCCRSDERAGTARRKAASPSRRGRAARLCDELLGRHRSRICPTATRPWLEAK